MHSYQIQETGKPLNKAKKAMIALHGRGGSSSDILSLARKLVDDDYYLVAPEAENNTWYPYNFMSEDPSNTLWVNSAVSIVKRLIDETSRHIPEIYLMGFSQGACLALEVSARYAAKYGGVIAFSGGLIGHNLDEKKYQGTFQGTKIFIGISDNDPHVPLQRAKESEKLLKKLGANVYLNVYEGMGHTIIQDEIDWTRAHIMTSA